MATLAERVGRIAEQTRQRVVDGVTPAGATRMVSLHDPDARPIRKGRLGKPVGECGIDTDENLESQYWEGDRRLVHIGTEDIDILERRLPYCRFLGAPPPRYTDHPTYVAGGMNVTIPYLKRGTTITLHYIVAENPLPEPMEYSTSYAVDLTAGSSHNGPDRASGADSKICQLFSEHVMADESQPDRRIVPRSDGRLRMEAVVLTGHGGFDKLEYRVDVPAPRPSRGEVLIRVRAAGVNNTDINTRTGWYSKAVSEGSSAGGSDGFAGVDSADAAWGGTPMQFPRIQGADVCGHIEQVGEHVDPGRIGERVLVRTMLRAPVSYRPYECVALGSECDGGFAQLVVAPADDTYAVRCDWTDAELASIPCAYSTAENMLHRTGTAADTVLVTGASGGVGSAAVQLARARGATVIAVASSAKAHDVRALGADTVVDRSADLRAVLGHDSVDVVVDVVGGSGWPQLLDVLKRGGRYAVAGAIAGPVVELDLRTLYLKDVTVFGCTFQEDAVFEHLISSIEAATIRPVVARTYPLRDIVAAQQDFLAKSYVGKLVLIPPQDDA